MGSQGGASQTEGTAGAKVLRQAWAWQGDRVPKRYVQGQRERGEAPGSEVLRGGGACVVQSWRTREGLTGGRAYWGGLGADVAGSGENFPGSFRRLCRKGLWGQERAARGRSSRPGRTTAGIAGVPRGAEGQLAGRLCPDTGAEDRAGIHPGLAECSPRTRWEEAEQQWGGEMVAWGPCLVQKPVCRSPQRRCC